MNESDVDRAFSTLSLLSQTSTHISSLTTCATLFDPHGATLATEVRLAAREVCESVRALASSFLENSGEGYLIRTGSVHEIVENARRELSVDNSAAVRRRLTLDREILEDALGEVSGMIEGTDEVGDEGEDNFEDEWNELGLGSNKKMSEAELDRTKKIQPLVRFVALLQKRIVLDVLSSLPSRPPSSAPINDTLDSLPAHSHALVLAMEEVIASLYAPQDVSLMRCCPLQERTQMRWRGRRLDAY
ncbi:hypothetical protein A0H81_10814 [Grifola frondosa]|uniref:Uncharacterized protein n=1 Tax=Grifola frondosa TaxID=5627 RepID=A0A1C7LWW5_GRIFR|nr:hypothetical protein A0H81_10814 [Grifola frondosa]